MNTRRPLLTPLSRLAPALLLPFALSGCGGGGSNGATSTAPAPTPAPVLSASAVTPDGLTATLAQAKATVAVGDAMTYTLTLANNTSQPITFQTFGLDPAGVNGAVRIVDASNTLVYPASTSSISGVAGTFSGAITLTPGQTRTETFPLGSVLSAPGTYAATASVTTFASPSATGQTATVGPLTVTVQ